VTHLIQTTNKESFILQLTVRPRYDQFCIFTLILKGKSASALSTPFLHQLRETSNRIEMWIYVSWRLSCIADSFVELLGGMGEYQTHILFIYLFPWNKATCSRESCWS